MVNYKFYFYALDHLNNFFFSNFQSEASISRDALRPTISYCFVFRWKVSENNLRNRLNELQSIFSSVFYRYGVFKVELIVEIDQRT